MKVCVVDRAIGSHLTPGWAKELAALGHQVDIIGISGNYPRETPYRKFTMSFNIRGGSPFKEMLIKGSYAVWARRMTQRLHREESYDVIAVIEHLPALLHFAWGRDTLPALVCWTGGPLPSNRSSQALKEWARAQPLAWASLGVLAYTLEHANRVVVNSQTMKRAVITLFRIDPAKIDVVFTGVDPQRFTPENDGSSIRAGLGLAEDVPIILSVGGISPRKGQMMLLKAAPAVVRYYPKAVFLLVGPVIHRTYYGELQKWVHAHNLERSVLFTGPVPYEDIPQYYAAADVFVLPSTNEGMAEVLIEAMSAGKPCVASSIPQNREAARQGDEIVFVDLTCCQRLAQVLVALLDNQDWREELGRKARQTVLEHFQWSLLAPPMLRAFEKAISSFKAAAG